jgi:hypothetical protein
MRKYGKRIRQENSLNAEVSTATPAQLNLKRDTGTRPQEGKRGSRQQSAKAPKTHRVARGKKRAATGCASMLVKGASCTRHQAEEDTPATSRNLAVLSRLSKSRGLACTIPLPRRLEPRQQSSHVSALFFKLIYYYGSVFPLRSLQFLRTFSLAPHIECCIIQYLPISERQLWYGFIRPH